MEQKHIFLIGFMGCGKSSVASRLARSCGRKVLEMDELIVQQQQMSIPTIFERFGEEHFRCLETELLKSFSSAPAAVVSCGGGIPLREENVREMKKTGVVILLTATPETIYQRTCHNNNRPNLKNRKSPAAIAELLAQRQPYYEGAADFVVSTDDRSLTDISDEILRLLSSTVSTSEDLDVRR